MPKEPQRGFFSLFPSAGSTIAAVGLLVPTKMMALAEISNNIAGSVRTTGNSEEGNGTCLTSHIWAERKADFKPPPSLLQSMLKNTTETGDVGQFSIKPTRIPYPTTRRVSQRRKFPDTRARPRVSTLTSLQPCPGQHRGSEQSSEEYVPFRPYTGTSPSSVISLYQGESQKSFGGPSQNASRDYRSYPGKQGSPTTYKISNQPSLASLRAHRELTRSPLAYPMKLRRPGYRPSSPALSDFNGSECRTNIRLDRGTKFATSSPLSMQAKDRMPSTHFRGFSRSIPSHINPPSAFIPKLGRTQWKASAPTRVPTPNRLKCQPTARAATQDQRARSVPTVPTCSHQSPSPKPLYYDYTEAFEEESDSRSPAVSVDSLFERPIPEDCPVHYELDAKTVNDSIEILALGSASADSSVGSTYSANGDLPLQATRGIPMQTLQNGEIEASSPIEGCLSGCRSELSAPPVDVDERESEEELPALSEPSQQNLLVGCSSVSKDSDAGGVSSPNSSHTARGMVSSNSFLQFSSRRSCPPTDSLKYSFPKAEGAQEGQADIGDDSQAQWKNGSLNFCHLDLDDKTTCTSDSYGIRVLSSDSLVETEYAGIYAPVPERGLTSQSHPNKYSRILSIDENSPELAELVGKSGVAETRRSADRTGEDIESAEVVINSPRASSSIRRFSEQASPSLAATGSLTTSNPISLPDRDEDHQRVLSELIRQSLLWEYTHSNASSGHTENYGDGNVSQHLLQDSFSGAPAGNLTQTLSALMRDPAIVPINHKILASHDNGRPGVVKEKSNAESIKRLSRLPGNPSFRSFKPPDPLRSIHIPCVFSPLVIGRGDAALAANTEPSLSAYTGQCVHNDEGEESAVPRYKLKMRAKRDSTASPVNSRPWNLDASYPWDDQPSQVELRLPEPSRLHQQPVAKSRFKMKSSRASLLNEGTVRVKKQAVSSETGTTQQASKPIDLFRSPKLGRRGKSGLSALGTSSIGSLPNKLRIRDAVNDRPSTSGKANLIPPLSSLEFTEARSFFSDDSSQKVRKGSLRERLSYLKAMAIRNSSSEEGKGVDRGLADAATGKSRIHGQSSPQSAGATVGMSNLKYVRSKMVEKIKVWWQRGEERIRALGEMVKSKGHKSSSQNADLYHGA